MNVAITIRKLTSGFVSVQKSGADAQTVAKKLARGTGLMPSADVGEVVI